MTTKKADGTTADTSAQVEPPHGHAKPAQDYEAFVAQCKQAAREAGLTDDDLRKMLPPVKAAPTATGAAGMEAGAQAWGDGKFWEKLKKIFDFLERIGPILAPIFLEDKTGSKPPVS